MGRKELPLEKRKISLTISVPFSIWKLAKENGNRYMEDLIKRGLWAKKENINQLTLLKLQDDYEKKIIKLQKIIEWLGRIEKC